MQASLERLFDCTPADFNQCNFKRCAIWRATFDRVHVDALLTSGA